MASAGAHGAPRPGDEQVVVLAVLEGKCRRFPKRSRHEIVAEARFHGEQLSTDPVPHQPTLDIQNELAWVIDRKALQQHRMQRTPIKLQVYAREPESGARELVGYVMLDLRTIQATDTRAQWLPLLNTKYSKTKPELKVQLTLESSDDAHGDAPLPASPPRRQRSARPPSHPAAGAGAREPSSGQPQAQHGPPFVLAEDGTFEIGHGKQSFAFSLTIAFATDLPPLLPDDADLSRGLFFYYSLFGNDITTDPFPDPANPAFPPERASLRIRSSPYELSQYFQRAPPLHIHLCSGDHLLATAEIPLHELAAIYQPGLRTLEGAFPLAAPGMSAAAAAATGPASPAVGVHISLRPADYLSDAAMPSSTSVSPMSTPGRAHSAAAGTPAGRSPLRAVESAADFDEQHPRVQDPMEQPLPVRSAVGVGYSSLGEAATTDAEAPAPEAQRQMRRKGARTPTRTHSASATQPRHYSCTVDLRSVKGVSTGASTTKVFVRYTYPFFGSASPIFTQAVEVPKNSERPISGGFCSFDFVSTDQTLRSQFAAVPLVLELYMSEKYTRDTLLGTARVPLAELLEAPTEGGTGRAFAFDRQLPVVALEEGEEGSEAGDGPRVASLRVALALEDRGPAEDGAATATAAGHAAAGTTATSDSEDTASESELLARQLRQAVAASGFASQGEAYAGQDITAGPEYRVALELELWKRTAQEAFQQQLQKKEDALMKALAEEWKTRDRQRELLTKRKVDEYTKLEEELKTALADLERRERKLALGEEELERQRQDLEASHQRRLADARDASRRMQLDFEHKLELEKSLVSELRSKVERAEQHAADVDKRYRKLDNDFASFRLAQAQSPVAQMQAEMARLTVEKAEMERKVDQLTHAKQRYKAQWSRALQEVARLKQYTQHAAKDRMRREERELQHMRMQYLAREERALMGNERAELDKIRHELAQLQQGVGAGDSDKENASADKAELRRLIEERATLLRTGVYAAEDPVIREFNQRIQTLMAKTEA